MLFVWVQAHLFTIAVDTRLLLIRQVRAGFMVMMEKERAHLTLCVCDVKAWGSFASFSTD